MLTNLEWIGEGKEFPPRSEARRLERYRQNALLFDGRHKEVFGEAFRRVERQLNKRRMDPVAVFNYPQLLTRKTADFVCGEPPDILIGKEKSDALAGALDDMNFDAMLYEAVMDVSRYGNAPVKLVGDRVTCIAPDCWFPIVDATDLKRICAHVVAFGTEPDEDGFFTKIYVEIHRVGTVETRLYEAGGRGGLQFGKLLGNEETATGMDDFAVKVLTNVCHSQSVFGMDDYGIIKDLIEAIMWRVACIDSVLNKHSEPSLSGPASALSYDEATGMYFFDMGNYFKRGGRDDVPVEYLTWDGNMEASFQELEFLVNQLYILSEMGAAFMDGGGQGATSSAAALKLRLVSPRIKTQRIVGINTQPIKQLVAMIARARGISGVTAGDVSILWNDGIPDDPREVAELLSIATGGGAVMSQADAVKRWNRVDDAGAREILDEMRSAALTR